MTREEFGRYVVINYDTLLRFVQGRGLGVTDAEDVLQGCLLKLLPVCDRIDAARPDGLFFAVLRNAVVDFWRKRGRRPPAGPLPEHLAAPDLPDAIVSDDDPVDRVRELLAEAVAGLTPRQRKALAAYWRWRGDRAAALKALGLASADYYKVYDGPLHHARNKLGNVLLPRWPELADAGYVRLWRLLNHILNGPSPDADPES
jgi:hypothetical protein